MEHQFIIEGDEAYALATELANRRGMSLESAVIDAVRGELNKVRTIAEKVARVRGLTAAFRACLTDPLPSSADIDRLHDAKTGLPI